MAPKKTKNDETAAVQQTNGTDAGDDHDLLNGDGDKPKAKGRGRPKKAESEKPAENGKSAAAGDAKPKGRPAAAKAKAAIAAEPTTESSGEEAEMVTEVKKARPTAAPKKTGKVAEKPGGAAKKGRGRPPKKVNGD